MPFSVTDQLGHTIVLPAAARRIISIVPSQTELLSDLGLDEEVVGITKFCVHPASWFQIKQRIGGTKKLRLDLIDQLKPDLILANKEENTRSEVEELATRYPLWVSDIQNLEDSYQMIRAVGELTATETKASGLVNKIQTAFAHLKLKTSAKAQAPKKAAYLIWRDPYLAAGGDTFISHLMQQAGLTNIFQDQLRYPSIDIQELAALGCEVLLLSSEPFPFFAKHVAELQPQLLNVRIELVDGELFSWYGSRLQYAPAYFEDLGHRLRL